MWNELERKEYFIVRVWLNSFKFYARGEKTFLKKNKHAKDSSAKYEKVES